MTDSITTARQAIQAEIKRLAGEQAKLEKILVQLGEEGTSSDAGERQGNGKRKYTRRQKANDNDVQNAIKLIEKAGKGGIKAIKLAYEMKRAGGSKVGKAELLASDKIKMTGTGGGSTYVYVG